MYEWFYGHSRNREFFCELSNELTSVTLLYLLRFRKMIVGLNRSQKLIVLKNRQTNLKLQHWLHNPSFLLEGFNQKNRPEILIAYVTLKSYQGSLILATLVTENFNFCEAKSFKLRYKSISWNIFIISYWDFTPKITTSPYLMNRT